MKQRLTAVLLVISFIFILAMPYPLLTKVGKNDFRAYWSASYLLARSENFSDPARILQVEQEKTDYQVDAPLNTWNPPWLLALLIPYTFVTFARASWSWLLTNIFLIFSCSVLVWQQSANRETTHRWGWVAALIAFAFPPTLIALAIGQVSTIVFAGLAAFYFFEARSQVRAGIALALTTVKPHLVYVTTPLVLLELARSRRWRTLGAFGGTLVGLTAIVFLLRPAFPFEYSHTVTGGGLLSWETPTLGGFLHKEFGWQWVKLAGFIVLPLAIIAWRRQSGAIKMQHLVEVTLLVSVVSAPFGWSFDFVVLLLPLLRIGVWIFEGEFSRSGSFVLVLALLTVYTLSFYQRLLPQPTEVNFFWVPFAIASLYIWARAQREQRPQRSIP